MLIYHSAHPSFYQTPVMRELARRMEFRAIFSTHYRLEPVYEDDYGRVVDYQFDIGGFDSEVLPHIGKTDMAWHYGLAERLRELKPKAVIVAGWWLPCQWQTILTCIKLRIPFFLRAETTDLGPPPSLITRIVQRWLCRKAAACLAIGTRSQNYYLNRGVPEDKIFLSPYAVDNDYLMHEVARWRSSHDKVLRDVGLEPAFPTILVVGKLIRRKRPWDALFVHKELWASDIFTNLLFVGDGPLRYLVDNLHTNVKCTGFVGQREIARYYAVSDMLLHPAEFETWGLVINEALCAGLPVVTTHEVGAAHDLPALRAEMGNIRQMCEYTEWVLAKQVNSGGVIKGWSPKQSADGIEGALSKLTREDT